MRRVPRQPMAGPMTPWHTVSTPTARADAGPGGDPQATIATIAGDTGKGILIVGVVFGTMDPATEENRDIWSVNDSGVNVGVDVGSREAGVAMAEAFVASQPDPSMWVILVAD